ncbi:MAG: YraN family protein [Candidatus Methylopumilus sp.]|jgi:putative endonuclease
MNTLGSAAEQLAADYLQQQGLTMITCNYRCKFGEIDLVMREAKTLVFVEVRLRSNPRFGNAAASITPAKQQKIARTAEHYLQQHGNSACRFDAVVMDKADTHNIEWIRNAFDT